MGHLEEALDISEKVQQTATELKFPFDKIIALRLHGITLLSLDKIEEAKKTASLLENYLDMLEIPKYKRYFYHLAGMIAQHESRYSEAVDHYSKAISLLPHESEVFNDHAFHLYSLAMAYYKMNDLEKAQEQFAYIIELTAKIHQEDGEKQKAIDNYKIFLQLWKNADSGMPEIKQAKNELVALK
jgi:tetratricopeptide (TPR) repeat protein